jgi:DNA primase
MKLYNIAKSLILEVASIESVIDAIRNKNRIVIYYDGDEPGGKVYVKLNQFVLVIVKRAMLF